MIRTALLSLVAAAASFATLLVVFVPLERLFPARRGQPILRPAFFTDLAFFAGQYLLWVGLSTAILARLQSLVQPSMPPILRATFASWPFALQALVIILLGDVSVYWFHRACHAIPWLWRIHSIHHSAEHLDWLAAHREHPLDGILTQLAVNAPAILLGFSVGQVAGIAALRGVWAIFVHSNVRIPLGPLRVLLGAPELHRWHHLRRVRADNFANLAPWTDLLFGTYHCPPGESEDWPIGVEEPMPRSYLGMLAWPLRFAIDSLARASNPTPRSQAAEPAAGSVSARVTAQAPQTNRLAVFESANRAHSPGSGGRAR